MNTYDGDYYDEPTAREVAREDARDAAYADAPFEHRINEFGQHCTWCPCDEDE